MGKTSRRKGADYERQCVGWFQKSGLCPSACRSAPMQAGSHGDADLRLPGLPIHIECKNDKRRSVQGHCRQVEAEVPAGLWPVVMFHIPHGGDWVVMRRNDWCDLMKEAGYPKVPGGYDEVAGEVE